MPRPRPAKPASTGGGGQSALPPVRALSPRALQVVDAARDLLESEGPDALTMRRIGEALGIRAPSIYKHFSSKRAVETALIEGALLDMGVLTRRAVSRGAPSTRITRLLTAYRRHGLTHPNLYRLATVGQLPRETLMAGLEDWAAEPFFLATGSRHLAQALWSFAHGMVILELDERYPGDADLTRTWAAGAKAFAQASRPSVPSATRKALPASSRRLR